MVIGQFFQVLCHWVVVISASMKLTSLGSDQSVNSQISFFPPLVYKDSARSNTHMKQSFFHGLSRFLLVSNSETSRCRL